MVRLFKIMLLSCMAVLVVSCDAPEKDEPIWQHIKISDLPRSNDVKNSRDRVLKTINLGIHIFEIPAENISILNDVQQMLHTKPLQFNDYDAFCANSFRVGFGQVQIWNVIANVLRDAGGKQVEKVALLLPDSQTKDFTIAKLKKKQDIFYITSSGSMEGVTLGPGKLALRIKVEKIPGSRGVCKVNAQPAFPSLRQSPIPQLAEREKSSEFLFTTAGFELKMSPGDFILLGPEKYIGHQISLGSLFFSRPGRRPVVRIFLLICTRIID